MIGLDTNILARYYICEDNPDSATLKQRELAKQIIDSDNNLYIAKTVIIEFEWVLRGVYKFDVTEVLQVYEHLISLPNVTIEDKRQVLSAMSYTKLGLEFTDALHLASYDVCHLVYSFDNKKFAKLAHSLELIPKIAIPK